MEIAGLKVAREQLRNAVVVVYSIIVMATIIPGFATVSNLIILPYFILVPGYFAALLLRNTGTLLETLFYTLAWSIGILLSVYSLQTIIPGSEIPSHQVGSPSPDDIPPRLRSLPQTITRCLTDE